MPDQVGAEVHASSLRPSMQPLPQVYQPALESAATDPSSAPAHSMASGEKGEVAEYFGVSWTPEVSSRSPGGRIRRAVGRFTSVNNSPMRYGSILSVLGAHIPPTQAVQDVSSHCLPTLWDLVQVTAAMPGCSTMLLLKSCAMRPDMECAMQWSPAPGWVSAWLCAQGKQQSLPRDAATPACAHMGRPAHDPDARHAGASGAAGFYTQAPPALSYQRQSASMMPHCRITFNCTEALSWERATYI